MDKTSKLAAEINIGSIIRDHNYRPRDPEEPWGLCAVCKLAQAAHAKSDVPYVPTAKRAKKERVIKKAKVVRSKSKKRTVGK